MSTHNIWFCRDMSNKKLNSFQLKKSTLSGAMISVLKSGITWNWAILFALNYSHILPSKV